MKILVSILLILSSVIFTEIVLDLLTLREVKISLFELSHEGKTDTDTNENWEEDTEIEYLQLGTFQFDTSLTVKHDNQNYFAFGHFQEIPNPPPEA